MKSQIAFVALLPYLFLLPQCSSGPSNEASLPVLRSPSRSKAWGNPEMEQTQRGYKLTYSNPSNDRERVTIEGSRSPFFFLYYPPNLVGTRKINGVATEINEAQVWKNSFILNQRVKWYHRTLPNDDYGAIFRTLGKELKTSDGRKGHYRIEVEGSKSQMQRWLSELRFDPS